jgi:hypothetical protein
MSKKNEHQDITDQLASLRVTPERDPGQVTRGRAQFLLEAKQISEEPVSISWIQRLSSVFQAPQMRASTLTIAIIIGLLVVSFSTSAAAASQALPDQFLYPYKIWLENQRLNLTLDPEKEAELHLIYAQERLEEIETLKDTDHEADLEALLENYQEHLNSAEEIYAEYEEDEEQEDLIEMLQTQAPHPSPESEEEPDELEDEPEKTPEPESPNEGEEGESESSKEPEESESPESPDSGEEPDDTPEPGGDDSGGSPSDDPEPPGDSDDPPDPDETDEPDEDEDPEETDDPDDD